MDPRVTGRLRYSCEVERPGMLHAAFVRSPHPHARVRVGRRPPDGVVALLPEDVADLGRYGCQVKDQRVLADVARHVGDVVAAVAAPTRAAARAAARAVEVDVRGAAGGARPARGGRAAARRWSTARRPRARRTRSRSTCGRSRARTSATASASATATSPQGFAEADVVVEEVFRTAAAAHAPMEPHAALAEWEDDRLTLWSGTQTPFNTRADLAGLFGVDETAIRVIAPPMGGSFGAKTFVRLEALVAALARKAGRPVKAVLDRAEEFVTVNRHPAVVRVRIGARRDGTLVAKEVDCWADTGAYADCGPGVATKMGYAGVGPYRIPHVRVDSLAIYTNLPPGGAFRGYGATQSVWASERTMDLLAGRAGHVARSSCGA